MLHMIPHSTNRTRWPQQSILKEQQFCHLHELCPLGIPCRNELNDSSHSNSITQSTYSKHYYSRRISFAFNALNCLHGAMRYARCTLG